MRSYLRRKLAELSGCSSGNATIIVALGMPMLIGGAGFGVDLAQWYMWKRELQFAVDQAAIAGAWARTDVATQGTYQTRATQEFDANLAVVEDFASEPDVDLADYNGGTDNSVVVGATATRALPFSNFLTGESATIRVSAQAVVEGGQIFTTCMLATDPDDEDAFVLGGSVSGSASCGFGALSNAEQAMRKNGQTNIQAGYLVSGGGIDRGLAANGRLHENVDGLVDPYEDLEPPESDITRTFECPPVIDDRITTTADVTEETQYSYVYVSGKQLKKATTYNDYSPEKPDSVATEFFAQKTIENDVSEGTYEGDEHVTETVVQELNGGVSVWEIRTTRTDTTIENRVVEYVAGSDGIARPQPGTYEDITIECETRFAPGVYIVSGDLDFGQGEVVTGTDVMFVLLNGNKIHINADSDINMSGITANTLQSYGMAEEEAAMLAGMLIYDPESTEQMKVNGNATLKLEGVLYMPQREVWFNGASTVHGTCMMIAAGRITLTGNNHLGSFCVPAGMSGMRIGGQNLTVKLVA